jgi:hypothetical protein
MAVAFLATRDVAAEEPAVEKIDAKLLTLHRDEAQRWEMFVDSERTKKAEFVSEPVYRWNNRARANGQSGAMFVWTYGGRPVVLGGVFSNPEQGRRVLMHEFHALGPDRLFPRFNDSRQQWLPAAGVLMFPLPDGPAPEPTAARRTLQMRELARRFTAHTIDDTGARWQLRMLPVRSIVTRSPRVISSMVRSSASSAMPEPIPKSPWSSRR